MTSVETKASSREPRVEMLSNEGRERNRRALLWFLILTFVATWSLWSLFWIWGLRPADQDPRFVWLAVGAELIPGLAALIAIKRILDESWRTTTLLHPGAIRFYVWALMLPPVLVLATVCLSVVSGLARFDPNEMALSALPWAIASQAPMVAFFALGEEIGWRGFLLPRLTLSGVGEYQALAISGLIWGLWHAPIILRGYNYPEHPYLGIPMMTVFCTLIGTVFGWLRLASGSVWPAAAAHASVNLTLVQLASPLLAGGYDRTIAGLMTSVMGWIPLAGLCAWLIWTRRLPALHADSIGRPPAMAMVLR